jgi:aubergine-like protein
MYELP